jgi:hypothetical protein
MRSILWFGAPRQVVASVEITQQGRSLSGGLLLLHWEIGVSWKPEVVQPGVPEQGARRLT